VSWRSREARWQDDSHVAALLENEEGSDSLGLRDPDGAWWAPSGSWGGVGVRLT